MSLQAVDVSTSVSHHVRSASSGSITQEGGSHKEPLSAKTSVNSTGPTSTEPKCSTGSDRRHSFEMIDDSAVVRESQKAEMFEQQLMQLQEQLVNSMIENQNMCRSFGLSFTLCIKFTCEMYHHSIVC